MRQQVAPLGALQRGERLDTHGTAVGRYALCTVSVENSWLHHCSDTDPTRGSVKILITCSYIVY